MDYVQIDKKMPFMPRITVVVLLTVVISGSQSQMSVSVDISHTYAVPTKNITVICRVTGGDPDVVIMYKEIMTDEGKTPVEPISTNAVITPLYAGLGRFFMREQSAGSAHLYILTISSVTVQDSGHYGCYIPEQSDAFDSAKLEIYKQPDSVEFNGYSAGEAIPLVEGEGQLIECNISAVVPSPEVQIWVGNKEYTDQFIKHTKLEVLCGGSIGAKENCPIYFHYNVIMKHPTFMLEDYEHGEQLKCKALVPNSGYDNIIITQDIDYQHSPRFMCDTELYAVPGTKNYEVSCKVESNPEPFEWIWTFSIDGTDYKLKHSEDPGYSYDVVHVKEKKVDDKSSMFSLVIQEVSAPYFTQYHLAVFQEVGNKTITFNLHEGQETTTSSCTVMMSSFYVLVCSVLLWITML